jgi:hypothetical protein
MSPKHAEEKLRNIVDMYLNGEAPCRMQPHDFIALTDSGWVGRVCDAFQQQGCQLLLIERGEAAPDDHDE